MKNKRKLKLICALLCCVTIFTLFSIFVFGATDDFEKSIEAFPESYKPYLRELHEQYPEWVFEPFETGLDWETVIDNEFGKKNLVSSSAASNNLKSRLAGHYNASTNTFIQMDSGFVVANRLAVEYFMDPRNFLSEDEIFQFERLSFSDKITTKDVESVLKGSFMADKNISYYDADGALVQTDKKYSEVIYEAGKTYDINPCYIASKIRNELGADGSGSVSGTNSIYPGIYNFYNIGATDGAGAITRGLKWASEGSTYGRPWNTPEKSIMGGAKYLAESYIAVGQFTGYLQKFNVNPKSSKTLYAHQYMTNVTGALSQGYTVYNAYAKVGSLYQKHVFSIPVFKNMTTENGESEYISNADSAGQDVKISISSSACNVRTGPSTANAKLTDSSGNIIQLSSGQQVKVVGKSFTDSDYYINILQYPLWVKVSFTKNGKTYEGYVPEDFIAYTSITYVGTGEYTLPLHIGENIKNKIISSNTTIANVTSSGTVEFLKAGTVNLTVYDSLGRYDVVRYNVSSSAMAAPSLTVTSYAQSLKLSAEYSDTADKYIYAVSDSSGKIILNTESTKTSYTQKSLVSGEKYTVSVKATNGVKHTPAASMLTSTKPSQVTGVSMDFSGSDAVISWTSVDKCDGYIIYGYSKSSSKYTKLGTAKSTAKSYTIKAASLIYDSYHVRAYCKNGSKYVYGAYSDASLAALTPPQKIKVSAIKTDGYTLTWDSTKGATGYNVYSLSGSEWKKLASVTNATYTATKLSPGVETAYAVSSVNGSNESEKSSTFYAITLPSTVTGFKSSSVTSSGFKLSWDKVSGAALYKLYYYQNGAYTLFGQYTAESCTFTSLKQLTEYKFKLLPTAKGDNTELDGIFSDELSVVTMPQKPTGLVSSDINSTGFTLSWTENDKADSYNVYTYDESTKKYTKLMTVKTAKAVITSLKAGTSYKLAVDCTGTCAGKSYTSDKSALITVKTNLAAPTSLAISNIKADSYKLSWAKVSGATGYNVYIKSGSKFVKKASVTTNSYTASKLTSGKADTYKVSAVYTVSGKSTEGELSSEFLAATTPAKTANLAVTPYTTSAKITWSAVTGATHYDVYIYDSGEYVLKSTVTTTSCKLTGLTAGGTYRFAVRARIELTSGSASGSKTAISTTLKPSKVTKVTVSSVTTTGHKLSWTAPKGANYYYIYRYNSSKGKYVKVASTSAKSYSFSGLSAGTTYSYIIYSAVLKDGKELSCSDKSSVFKFATLPSKVTGLKSTSVATNKVTLSWTKVSGATSYQVYYYSAAKGKYVLAGTTSKNTYTVSSLSSKTSYKFKVRAIRTVNSKNYVGAYSAVVSAKTK